MPYVKLDTGILDSTLWVSDPETRIVFITMLAMAGPDGMCESTAPGIARRANIGLESVRRALAVLEAPDEDSRSLDLEGRRVVREDGGYRIVNYLKYRDKDHTAAQRMRRMRERQNRNAQPDVTHVTRNVTQAEAEADTDIDISLKFDRWWSAYPRRVGKAKALRVFAKINPSDSDLDRWLSTLAAQKASDQWQDKRYIPHPTTYLNEGRHDDEVDAPVDSFSGVL